MEVDKDTITETLRSTLRMIDQIIGESFHSCKLEEGRHPVTKEVAFKFSATCRACSRVIEISRKVRTGEEGGEFTRLILERTVSHSRLHSIIIARH